MRRVVVQDIEDHLRALSVEEIAYSARTGYRGGDPYDVNWDMVFQLDHRLGRAHTCTRTCRRIAAARTAPEENE